MGKIAIIDLDDTIVNLVPCFLDSFNREHNLNLTPDDWIAYDMYTRYGVTSDQFSDFLVNERIFEKAQPIAHAQVVLKNVQARGYQIQYLTARGCHPDAYNISRNWLWTHGFPFENNGHLHIVDLNQSKSKYVREQFGKKVDLVIEDSARNVRSFITERMADRVFLINQPWNLLADDLEYHRIADINEINHFIEIGYI